MSMNVRSSQHHHNDEFMRMRKVKRSKGLATNFDEISQNGRKKYLMQTGHLGNSRIGEMCCQFIHGMAQAVMHIIKWMIIRRQIDNSRRIRSNSVTNISHEWHFSITISSVFVSFILAMFPHMVVVAPKTKTFAFHYLSSTLDISTSLSLVTGAFSFRTIGRLSFSVSFPFGHAMTDRGQDTGPVATKRCHTLSQTINKNHSKYPTKLIYLKRKWKVNDDCDEDDANVERWNYMLETWLFNIRNICTVVVVDVFAAAEKNENGQQTP